MQLWLSPVTQLRDNEKHNLCDDVQIALVKWLARVALHSFIHMSQIGLMDLKGRENKCAQMHCFYSRTDYIKMIHFVNNM